MRSAVGRIEKSPLCGTVPHSGTGYQLRAVESRLNRGSARPRSDSEQVSVRFRPNYPVNVGRATLGWAGVALVRGPGTVIGVGVVVASVVEVVVGAEVVVVGAIVVLVGGAGFATAARTSCTAQYAGLRANASSNKRGLVGVVRYPRLSSQLEPSVCHIVTSSHPSTDRHASNMVR